MLVERGLLSEEQLIEGLLEQNRTGEKLGQVLIRLGFVDPPNVAMALATQHGGPLKTEYGFATGFLPSSEPAMEQPLRSDQRLASKPDVESGGSPTHAELIVSPGEDVASEPSTTSAEPAERREDVAESPQTEPTSKETAMTEAGHLPLSAAEHHRGPSQIDTMTAAPDAAQAELDAARTRIADLEQELVAAREQLDERRSKTAELEDKVASARRAAETAIGALQGAAEPPS
jgi:hypothetical protein